MQTTQFVNGMRRMRELLKKELLKSSHQELIPRMNQNTSSFGNLIQIYADETLGNEEEKKEVSDGRLEKEVEKNNEVQKEVTDWASELQSKKVRNEERDKYIETKKKRGWLAYCQNSCRNVRSKPFIALNLRFQEISQFSVCWIRKAKREMRMQINSAFQNTQTNICTLTPYFSCLKSKDQAMYYVHYARLN